MQPVSRVHKLQPRHAIKFICLFELFLFTVLARAVNSFARIGNEIFLEGSNNGLSIRTVNSTKSAFAMILFQPAFFIEFNIADSEDILSNMCKLSLKSLLGVFKNMRLVNEIFINSIIEHCNNVSYYFRWNLAK